MVTRLAAEVLPPMLPATWVPCPNGSPVTFGSVDTKFARATILPSQRRVFGDARIDDRNADALAAVTARREEAEQAARAFPHELGAGEPVRNRHVGDNRKVTGDVGGAPFGDQRAQILRADINRHCARQSPPQPAAVTRPERLQCRLVGLDDHARGSPARQRRPDVVRQRCSALPLRRSRPHRGESQKNNNPKTSHHLLLKMDVSRRG